MALSLICRMRTKNREHFPLNYRLGMAQRASGVGVVEQHYPRGLCLVLI